MTPLKGKTSKNKLLEEFDRLLYSYRKTSDSVESYAREQLVGKLSQALDQYQSQLIEELEKDLIGKGDKNKTERDKWIYEGWDMALNQVIKIVKGVDD